MNNEHIRIKMKNEEKKRKEKKKRKEGKVRREVNGLINCVRKINRGKNQMGGTEMMLTKETRLFSLFIYYDCVLSFSEGNVV